MLLKLVGRYEFGGGGGGEGKVIVNGEEIEV